MPETADALLEKALVLSSKERAELVEKLLASLDQPDAAVDSLWASEAEDRIQAYEAGEIPTISADDIYKKYKKP